MGYRMIGWLVLIIVVVIGAFSFMAYKKPIPALAAQVTAQTPAAVTQPNLSWPATEAAIGASGYGVLATHGTQKTLPTASVAKVMNALMVLRAKPLAAGQQGPTLIMTPADVNLYNSYVAEDGSVAKVSVGEKITEYQLLEAMLLPSADNIADTLATWAYGSISAYSAAANAYTVKLGMTHSYFGTADASGYSPQTTSTAHDLVLLGQAALQNPVIAGIVAQPSTIVPVAGTVHNVNWLLGSYGINGIKTGNTDQAGGVYLFSAPHTYSNGQTITIVGAIMDANSLSTAMNEAVPLLKSTQENFRPITFFANGQTVGRYHVPWAGNVDAVATRSLTQMTWQDAQTPPHITLKPLPIPTKKGTIVGTIMPGSDSAVPIAIVLKQAVAAPSWSWRILHGL